MMENFEVLVMQVASDLQRIGLHAAESLHLDLSVQSNVPADQYHELRESIASGLVDLITTENVKLGLPDGLARQFGEVASAAFLERAAELESFGASGGTA